MSPMIPLYQYSRPHDLIETTEGTMPVIDWLEQEKERILKQHGRVAEIKYWGDHVTLMVNDVADHEPQATALKEMEQMKKGAGP